jgi:hypothetical protein
VHGRAHLRAAAAILLAGGTLAGCSAPRVKPAPEAANPACARALAAAPPTVLGQSRTDVQGQGALAWGDPMIVLRCGLPGIGPTTDPCVSVNDVDWVVADPDGDPVVFAAYGRSPTVEVDVPASYGRTSATGALVGLGGVVKALPSDGRSCL